MVRPFRSVVGPSFAVQKTDELDRIRLLPRRIWTDAERAELAAKMTPLLRTPNGQMTLRPHQAVALQEVYSCKGAVFAGHVGAGKSLFSFLLPYCLGAKRPLLVIPAKLMDKTLREIRRLSVHWVIPNFIRLISYELLGRAQSADTLTNYQPDLIMLDEGHRAKNRKAAVTRRLERYLAATPSPLDASEIRPEPILVNGIWTIPPPCTLVVMSGTITNRSINDYAHLLRRCLGPKHAPVPKPISQTDEWAAALDQHRNNEVRIGTGALVLLCNEEEAELHKTNPVVACRTAFRRRLVETPGVVVTADGQLGASLSIQALYPEMNADTVAALKKLRKDWELPNDIEIEDGLTAWRHAREVGLGLFYQWSPAAPPEWMAKRKAWFKRCRYILTNNHRNLDSSLPVVNAILAGHYPEAEEDYRLWREIEPTFKPHNVPIWFDDGAIQAAAKWAKEGPGVIWCEQVFFAKRLAEVTGLRYFGRKGLDAQKRPIPEFGEPGCGEGTIIASISSNGEGRNLQGWNRNLITCPPSNGKVFEQLLGRTHRELQEADEVSFEIFVTCREYAEAFWQATDEARFVCQTIGAEQKLLYADVDMPDAGWSGLR